ncbi:MAG: hypothetical protein GY832_32610 [Chloroflexi bacterium]|nr:hypothetical protein [Chloroflexota bacterium]
MSEYRNSRNRTWLSLLIVIGLALSQLTCNLSAPDTPVPTNTPEPIEQPPPESTTTTTPPPQEPEPEQAAKSAPPAGPGMACLGSFGYGLTCLNETGWQTFNKDNSPLGGNLITSISTCPDGSLLIAHSSGISGFDGETWKGYERGWGYSNPEAMACDAAGGIWVAHFRGVSYHDGRSWTTHPSEQLATGAATTDLIQDVAIAPGGRVWVVTASSVAMLDSFDSDEWTIFQEGRGFHARYFFDKIALDAQGNPWITHSSGILTFDDGTWTPYSNRDLSTVESMAIDAQGHVWVGTLSKGVYVFQDGGWSVYNDENSELESNHVRNIVVDAQDRVWMGTEWGLYILDGTTWQAYRMNNADLADNNIYALAVVKAGPTLPEPMEKASGSMKGRVVLENGQPVAGSTVEICVERLGSSFYGETPCADQPFIRITETDADGHFAFSDLPVGLYVLSVNIDGNWTQLTTELGFSSERIPVEAGQETYLGEFIVGTDE